LKSVQGAQLRSKFAVLTPCSVSSGAATMLKDTSNTKPSHIFQDRIEELPRKIQDGRRSRFLGRRRNETSYQGAAANASRDCSRVRDIKVKKRT
jgi:hypothetical protein